MFAAIRAIEYHLPEATLTNQDLAATFPDWPLAKIAGKTGIDERRIAAQDLFHAALTTSLAPLEIITEVRFPTMPPQAAYAVEEFARRKGDFAIAAIAVMLVRDGERCTKARLATAGVGPTSVRLRDAEAVLEQQGLGEAAIAEAGDKAAAQVDPISDLNGSAEYRRHLTGVLTGRAVLKAITPTT